MQESEQQQFLEAEYKKTGIRPEDIAVLRQWVLTQPHLPAQHITDLDLILTYHSCDQSTEVSKQVLDLNLTLRTLFTSIFKDRQVDDGVIKSVKSFTFLRLRIPDITYTVTYCRIGPDASKFDITAIIKLGIMQLDLWQYEDGTWPGFIIIIDLCDYSLGHLAKSNLQSVREVFYYLQEAQYMKIKGIHFINIPTIMDKVMSFMRPFIKKELLDILHIHSTGSHTLGDHSIPLDALPKEVGGQYKSLEEIQNDIVDSLVANKKFFMEENKKRVNEALRPGKPKTLTDIFGGVEGSFKQLNID